ncbi:hypothetical protein BaRGS_00003923 [Batillaria attramentaria]|uniref:Apple domain-containing protein n=1 Tax=Batillaria attramentaria TaxID=370345 RepID=A0ABD0LZC2_9CAEN
MASFQFWLLILYLTILNFMTGFIRLRVRGDTLGSYQMSNEERCRRLCRYHWRCSHFSYSYKRPLEHNCVLHTGYLAILEADCGWVQEEASQSVGNACGSRLCDDAEVCVPSPGQPFRNCLPVSSEGNSSSQFSAADGLQFLACRLTAGVNQSAYDKYVDSGTHDDTPQARASLLPGCLTLNGSLPCNTHYRSRLLDEWPGDAIDTVRVSVYNNGQQQRYVTFNGTGSTFLSWFAQDRVMASDWSDVRDEVLHRRGGFFSIEGFKYKRIIYRSFYVNRYHDGCSNDAGWLLVAEKDTCSYVPSAGPFPVILFSSADTYVNRNEAGYNKQADVLAVTVKFKKTPVAAFSGRCDP